MAGVLVEPPVGGEDDERDLGVTEHGDLVRLLQQPVPALGEGHLAVDLVLDPPQLHRPAPHPRRFPTYPLPLSSGAAMATATCLGRGRRGTKDQVALDSSGARGMNRATKRKGKGEFRWGRGAVWRNHGGFPRRVVVF